MKKRNTPKLDKILVCVREICKSKRGKVSELANYLGLKQAGQVSNWISPKSRVKPSAENLIGILEWIFTQKNTCGCEKCPAQSDEFNVEKIVETAGGVLSGQFSPEQPFFETFVETFVDEPQVSEQPVVSDKLTAQNEDIETASDHTLNSVY